MYHVPISATLSTLTLKIQLYGAYKDKAVKIQMHDIEITLAFNGIAPVSKNSLINYPKTLRFVTHKYILRFDRIKQPAAKIKKIVPGSPGNTYPAMPIPKNKNPAQ